MPTLLIGCLKLDDQLKTLFIKKAVLSHITSVLMSCTKQNKFIRVQIGHFYLLLLGTVKVHFSILGRLMANFSTKSRAATICKETQDVSVFSIKWAEHSVMN